MAALFKWLLSILLMGFVYLIAGYVVEYLRPYHLNHNRSDHRLR